MLRPPPTSTLFPYTTLFRSTPLSIYHPTYLVLHAGVANAFLAGDLFNLFVGFEILLTASYVLLTLGGRSEEHTSELQSRGHLVCRLLLEKKKRQGRIQVTPG